MHFAYANSADGKNNFNVSYFANALYVGTYTDYTQADSSDYTKYTWSRLKGDTGATGQTGATGAKGDKGDKGDTGSTGFFIGTTAPPNPAKGTVWATADSSGNMTSAKKWNGSAWVSTAFTQDLVAGNITADKLVGGTLDVNKVTIKNAQNIPVTSTVSLGKKLSDIEHDADGLLFTVKNDGQNLLRDTDTMPLWGGATEKVDTFTAVKAINTHTNGGTYDPIVWKGLTCIKPNTDYTLTFYARAGQNGVTIYSYLYNIGTNTAYKDGSTRNTLSTSYKRYEIHFHTEDFSDGRTVNCLPMRIITPNIACYIYGVQLEEGTIATAWSPSPSDISALKITADGFNAYVKGSKGSSTLKALLSMDPNNSTIGQVVNGKPVAAINMSSEGKVTIDGQKLHITASTTIDDASIKSSKIESLSADKINTGTLDAYKVKIKNLTADHIASGTLNGMTITGSKFVATTNNSKLWDKNWNTYKVVVENTGVDISGNYIFDNIQHDLNTSLTAGNLYIESFEHDPKDASSNDWRKSIDFNTDNSPYPYIKLVNEGPGAGKYKSTYISTDGITSNQVQADNGYFGNWHLTGSKARADGSLYVANESGTNFDSNGSVGFQVWLGIGLGKNTIYMPSGDLYVQQGNVGPALGQSYISAGKVQIHCQKVISQVANTVSSRLSVKTDITKVTYDRALAAVEGTDMYDYRYVADDSGQHYVSGIIDDINPDPQYHMDGMLINKERTARIDANLVGYHHVVIQKLLDRVAALEEKVK